MDKADELITAIGALSEISAEFFKQLIKNGVPKAEACKMVQSYITASITQSFHGQEVTPEE